MNKDQIDIPHSDVEYFGFAITDATIESGERIWVGAGVAGRWLTSMEVRELAAALVKVADTHDAGSAKGNALQRSSEIDAVQNWYAREGKRPGYWVPNALDPDKPQPTKERKALGHDVGRLIGYLERNDMTMSYREADDLKINLKQLVANAAGPGMVDHIARTRVHR